MKFHYIKKDKAPQSNSRRYEELAHLVYHTHDLSVLKTQKKEVSP